jgi:hypothetical protein
VHPRQLPWQTLYDYANASSFLHITGLNQHTFIRLLDYIFDLEEITHRRAHGRPGSLTSEGYLGLLLLYLGSTMSYKHLCLIFGITLTVCSRSVNWMLKKNLRLLRGHLFARVNFPNGEKMREYTNMVQMREPMVDDIVGFMDSVSFPAECTDYCFKQNAIYCGYDCDTMVNNVFAYGPDWKVFFAAINFPGSWADGSLTARFMHHMKSKIGNFKICIDQGFP